MRNQITSTLSNCIDSIQLKLSDFGFEKIEFQKILKTRFTNTKNPRNVNKNLELLDNNHFEYVNPTCPNCDSKKVIKQEFRERQVIIDDPQPLKLYLRRYQCKKCGKKFTTTIESIIKPHHKYSNNFRDKLDVLIKTGYRSLRNSSSDFYNFFGVSPSHQTIQNWLQQPTKNTLNNIITDYSGYYCYDEQYIKIKGIWHYRLTLFDHKLNLPVTERITSDKEYKTIKQFLIESTKNKRLISITTDHLREYKTIIDQMGAKHQLCLFHLYKMINNKIYGPQKSKKISKHNKKLLDKYFKEIREIFNTNDEKIAIKRLEKLLDNFNNIPHVLQKIINKKIIPDFQRLTQFMRDPNIPKTNNSIENYYRQTLPKSIKKIFKSTHGITNHIQLKMQNWTQKHGKHTNPQ